MFNDAVGQMDLTLELTSDLIKAAVAYCLVVGERWVPVEPNNFAWSVGGHDALCKIKAAAVMRSGGVPPRLITERVAARIFPSKVDADRCIFRSKPIPHSRAPRT